MEIQKHRTILLVEDQALIAMETKSVLKDLGYEVVLALSGEDAIQIITNNQNINLILMEMDLGSGIDGSETAKQIHTFRDLPIVFFSHHSGKEYVDKAKIITRYGYILKNSGKHILQSSLEMAFELFDSNQKLKNSEEHFQNLYNQAQDMYFTINTDGIVISVNKFGADYLGYTKEELIGNSVWQVVHKDDLSFVQNYISEVINQNIETNELEFRKICKDGSVIHVHEKLNLVYNKKGELEIRIICRDITEGKLAEKQIKQRENYLIALNQAKKILLKSESKDIFQQFIDIIGPVSHACRTYIFINSLDKNGKILMNQKAEYCADGIKPEIDNPDLQNLKYDDLFPRFYNVLKKGHIYKGIIRDFPKEEKEFLEIQNIKAILIIPIMSDNKFIGFIGFDNCSSEKEWSALEQNFLQATANDLAQFIEKNKSQELLLLENKRFQTTMNAIDAVVYVADMDTYELLFMNKYAMNIMGDVIGEKCYSSLQKGQTKPCDFCTNHLLLDENGKPNEPYIWEFQNTKTKQWYQCSDQAISWTDGRLVKLEIATDITESIQAKGEIQKLLKEKEILLKEVHHRIKNDMNVIKSLLSIQSRRINNSEASAALQDAISRVESMGTLYDKLYKSESYHDVSTKNYLTQLIDEIFNLFPNRQSVQIKSRIDDFSLEIKEIFPVGIILNELLTNSIKYAFPEIEKGLIQISLTKMKKHIILSYEDNGVGLPESDNVKQMGFGLTLIDLLTKQLNGTYKIERNNGTKFIIEFDK